MAVNVQTSNAVANTALLMAINAGAGGLAAQVLKSPIGFGGGALFGIVSTIVRIPLLYLSDQIFNPQHPQANEAARTMHAVLPTLASIAATWGLFLLSGASLTFSAALGLAAVSVLTSFIPAFLLECCKPHGRARVNVQFG